MITALFQLPDMFLHQAGFPHILETLENMDEILGLLVLTLEKSWNFILNPGNILAEKKFEGFHIFVSEEN